MSYIIKNNVERGILQFHLHLLLHSAIHSVLHFFFYVVPHFFLHFRYNLSFYLLFFAYTHEITHCKNVNRVEPPHGIIAQQPIFSVISNDIKLKNKVDYSRRAFYLQDGVKVYEQVTNKCKVYFLPLVWPSSEKGNHQGEQIQGDFNSAHTGDLTSGHTDDLTSAHTSGHTAEEPNTGGKETPFEYLQKNLGEIKKKIEMIATHIKKSELVIVPINYHDILNKHLLDIPQFSNFLNALDLIFLVNQTRGKHNVIFFIYNFYENDDNFLWPSKTWISDHGKNEKLEISKIVKSFLQNHWKENYQKCVNDMFIFEKENSIDFEMLHDKIERKKIYKWKNIPISKKFEKKQDSKSSTTIPEMKKNDRNSISIFSNCKVDTLKNATSENYFVYNFFSNLKISILHEYLKLASQLKIDDFSQETDATKINRKMNETIKDIDILINKFMSFQLNKKIIKSEKSMEQIKGEKSMEQKKSEKSMEQIKGEKSMEQKKSEKSMEQKKSEKSMEQRKSEKDFEQIKNKQYSYLVHIILTDMLEKYEHNLDSLIRYLYQKYKQQIKKIKISSNMINEFKKEIHNIDQLFDQYNLSISFIPYFKTKGREYEFQEKANYISYYMKMKLFQILNETTIEIVNYYISQGLYIQHYDFNSIFLSHKKYSIFSYLLHRLAELLKNKINFTFNYLSLNAFGLSSYKDDISISPKRDLMITTSEIDQVEKINIPTSHYSKILLSMDSYKK
ncbi:hypothetical protein, conserved [Plasmodium gonderi]|uniref:Uncharacterized protein n=1 Tax=Plasmodium gonderi TaxID=77519 RepID=A0A1Y1JF14_PLAGO|nr:hypothetical protein, conserved [Plasmodium gonderi]GAW80840.1 hypothetical protein, conserved [Plasmodium gonderi]